MSEPILIACSCGQMQIELQGADARTGTHAMCYCVDCQAFNRALGCADIMDEQGGTSLYQSQPHRVSITHGAAHLAVLQLKKKGLYRWYASCCDTPLCNTMGTPKMPFASFLTANMKSGAEQIGAIKFRHKPEQALNPVSEPTGALWKFALRAMTSMVAGRLSGKWKQTPFFDITTGRSVIKPRVLSEDERLKAYSKV